MDDPIDNPRVAWERALAAGAASVAAVADGTVTFIDIEARETAKFFAAEAASITTLNLLYKGRAEGTLSPLLLSVIDGFDARLQAKNKLVRKAAERIAQLPEIPVDKRRKPFIDWRQPISPKVPK